MPQHTLGVVGYLVCFVYNLLFFSTVKNFENRLGFDKVITISWVVHFLGHSVYSVFMPLNFISVLNSLFVYLDLK